MPVQAFKTSTSPPRKHIEAADTLEIEDEESIDSGVETSEVLGQDDLQAYHDDDDKYVLLYQLVEAFFRLNDSPSDEQMHSLASALGMDPESLESHIYEFFSDVLEGSEGETLGDPDEYGEEDEDEDDGPYDLHLTTLESADADGRAAENNGRPDLEQFGQSDVYKEASEHDGAPDEELIEELLENAKEQ